MSTAPRLTIGLPVYNGEKYIAESLEALLGQSFTDFELIISDNASTDSTGDICRRYEKQDSRVRYCRQPRNIGLAPNHNFVAEQARGELFKWASNDDLYARNLLESCIDALDKYPDVVLAHAWTAKVNDSGVVTEAFEYPLNTASPRAPERFRSLLFVSGGDDDYGVMRTEVLRRTAMKESYHHADRTIIAELSLHGRFYQVPDWLYFRRDHPGQSGRADHAEPLREHGSTPGGPAAASGGPALRRVRLGLHQGDPARTAVARGPARVLPLSGAVVRQPRPPGYRRTGRTCSGGSSEHPGRLHRGWPPGETFVSLRPPGQGETAMSSSAGVGGPARESAADVYKRDFWVEENQKHIPAHYRLQKSARIINAIAGRKECDLLDVGCGPATLMRLLQPNIHYYGIDIAIHEPAPNLIEADILKEPIRFAEKRFDIVAALGLFEYVGACQNQKFSEIAQLLGEHGRFVLTYTNFGHRDKRIFEAFSNVQPLDDFRRSLARHFTIDRYFPTSYNWHGGQPIRPLLRVANMHVKANLPLVGPRLAVEYFFFCSRR